MHRSARVIAALLALALPWALASCGSGDPLGLADDTDGDGEISDEEAERQARLDEEAERLRQLMAVRVANVLRDGSVCEDMGIWQCAEDEACIDGQCVEPVDRMERAAGDVLADLKAQCEREQLEVSFLDISTGEHTGACIYATPSLPGATGCGRLTCSAAVDLCVANYTLEIAGLGQGNFQVKTGNNYLNLVTAYEIPPQSAPTNASLAEVAMFYASRAMGTGIFAIHEGSFTRTDEPIDQVCRSDHFNTNPYYAEQVAAAMVEASYLYEEATNTAIENVLAASDAQLASSNIQSIAVGRAVSGQELSRAAAAHLLVGGFAGLRGSTTDALCDQPDLTPQARAAIGLIREAAIAPADILDPSLPTETLLNGSLGTCDPSMDDFDRCGSVHERLQELFGAEVVALGDNVEDLLGLRTEDFVRARSYLQQEIQAFSRSREAVMDPRPLVGERVTAFPRFAGTASKPPRRPGAYWAALAEWEPQFDNTQGFDLPRIELDTTPGDLVEEGGSFYLESGLPYNIFEGAATSLAEFVDRSRYQVLLLRTNGWLPTDDAVRRALMDPLDALATQLAQQHKGTLAACPSPGVTALYVQSPTSDPADLMVVNGEDGLACATGASVEGADCAIADYRFNTGSFSVFGTSLLAEGAETTGERIYLIERIDAAKGHVAGNYRVLGGMNTVPPESGGCRLSPLVPTVHDRVARVLAPDPDWCTRSEVSCAGERFDERLPLEDELTSDGDPVESSWRHFLALARQAADESDMLGESVVKLQVDELLREERAQIRQLDRTEAAIEELQDLCGITSDPSEYLRLLSEDGSKDFGLLAGAPCTQVADCPGYDPMSPDPDLTCNNGRCTETCGFTSDCSFQYAECVSGVCTVDPVGFVEGLAGFDGSSPFGPGEFDRADAQRLATCVSDDTTSDLVTLGDKELCYYGYSDPTAPSGVSICGQPDPVCDVNGENCEDALQHPCPVIPEPGQTCDERLPFDPNNPGDPEATKRPSGSVTARVMDTLGLFETIEPPPRGQPLPCEEIRSLRAWSANSERDVRIDTIRRSNFLHPDNLEPLARRIGWEARYGGYSTITLDGMPVYSTGDTDRGPDGTGDGWPCDGTAVPADCAGRAEGLFCDTYDCSDWNQRAHINDRMMRAAVAAAATTNRDWACTTEFGNNRNNVPSPFLAPFGGVGNEIDDFLDFGTEIHSEGDFFFSCEAAGRFLFPVYYYSMVGADGTCEFTDTYLVEQYIHPDVAAQFGTGHLRRPAYFANNSCSKLYPWFGKDEEFEGTASKSRRFYRTFSPHNQEPVCIPDGTGACTSGIPPVVRYDLSLSYDASAMTAEGGPMIVYDADALPGSPSTIAWLQPDVSDASNTVVLIDSAVTAFAPGTEDVPLAVLNNPNNVLAWQFGLSPWRVLGLYDTGSIWGGLSWAVQHRGRNDPRQVDTFGGQGAVLRSLLSGPSVRQEWGHEHLPPTYAFSNVHYTIDRDCSVPDPIFGGCLIGEEENRVDLPAHAARVPLMPSFTPDRAHLLDAMELLCEVGNRLRVEPCHWNNPPTFESVDDLPAMRSYMECLADEIDSRAAYSLVSGLPTAALNALDREGAGPSDVTGGKLGSQISKLRAALVRLSGATPQLAGQIRLLATDVRDLQLALEDAEVRKQLANVEAEMQLIGQKFAEFQMAMQIGQSAGEGYAQGGPWMAVARGLQSLVGAGMKMSQMADLASAVEERQGLQETLADIAANRAVNGFEAQTITRTMTMQNIATEISGAIEDIDAALFEINLTRDQARRALGKAMMMDTDFMQAQFAVNVANRLRLNTARRRYEDAQKNARRMAFFARRAIEQRLGVDMSTIREDLPLVKAPAEWVDSVCQTAGIDFDDPMLFDKAAQETITDYADAYIGDYVTKLENVVESYRLQHNFHEGSDTAIISLRDDVMNVRTAKDCFVPVNNLLFHSGEIDPNGTAWELQGCPDNTVPSIGTSGAPTTCMTSQQIGDDVIRSAYTPFPNALPAYRSSPAYGVTFGPASDETTRLSQTVSLSPGAYRLSWYGRQSDSIAPANIVNLVPTGATEQSPLAALTPGTAVPTDPSNVVPSDWNRYFKVFSLTTPQDVRVEIGNTMTGVVGEVELAAFMLEDISDVQQIGALAGLAPAGVPVPRPYAPTGTALVSNMPVCEDTFGDRFRIDHFGDRCERLCSDGFQAECGGANVETHCYKEIAFSVNQRDIEAGKMLNQSGFARGNFNYRVESIGVNFVGTGTRDCADSQTPSTCFSGGTIPYSITHLGPYFVRNHDGEDYQAHLFTGNIEHARGLAAERYLTNPLSSADRNLIEPLMRGELQGRPLDGTFLLKIWLEDNVNFDAIEDVQVVLNYRYWTRFD